MILIADLDFSLPLKNPVIIFSLVLFIILFAPILFNRIRIPHIIGLIISGIIIGPYGLNLLRRDSSIVLFGTVGLLYIMFMAGLEIDLEEFRKSRNRIITFGLYTFLIPMVLGTLAAFYWLDYTLLTSLLLASMFASHTLLAYSIVSRYGITRNPAVTLTIGGTMITDVLALLVLATIVGMTKGDISSAFWIRLIVSFVIFAAIVLFGFPLIARWFFKKYNDNISQYIFVLALVFLGAFLAEAAGLEAVIGAFLSGLALNRFIPHSSPLMNRIDFVGNALFIPFFLIGVGMLVDIRVLFNGLGALKVAAIMIGVAVLAKYLAAWLTQKTFRLSGEERQLIFGLSNARAAATLAIVLVGYNIITGETATGEPIRLLNEDVLNGTILLILITCTISSLTVEKASGRIALLSEEEGRITPDTAEKIMISLAYPETVTDLVNLGLMLKPARSTALLYALHVVDEEDNQNGRIAGKKMLDLALRHAAATDNELIPITRFDANISNGIIYTIKEQNITDVVIGLHHEAGANEFFGPIAEQILKRVPETIYIYKTTQPLNTLQRMVVAVPPKAELEPGFGHWYDKITNLAREAGLDMLFYAHPDTIRHLEKISHRSTSSLRIAFKKFQNWSDFLILGREIKPNDLFMIISSRKGHPSYSGHLDKLPYYLTSYFESNSFIILYPKQLETASLNVELFTILPPR
ncbi:putative Na(+)/H(+) antiporter 3 AltName: Full=MjNapA [Fibrisoma limi BUZ 3]|uniref:WGS project CAIT00000000 data, contig 9 n=1 Tax=Fibrisoma limi BUZ 3 TaxID=1185876 RepID=I2GQW8_9BACT|nr:cation:proton antiporter [Fibrisoma limi]CCH56296.1 putative Na(+)/H(+) antiporter 3 AltName: Full=MjNapA [Fibrisoma limi BUZ 3]